MKSAAALFAAGIFSGLAALEAQCVGSDHDPYNTVGRIRLVPSGFPANLSNVVANGMDFWNNSSCNTSGTSFPVLQSEATGAERTITVTYVEGLNPVNPRECGNFAGNEILIFTQGRDASGVLRTCGGESTMAQTVAHEIGHLFGLVDQRLASCTSFIMSQLTFRPNGTIIPRSVQQEECAEANRINIVPAEQPASPGPDPYCDAYCWTSCEGGVCPTRPPTMEGCPIILDLGARGIDLTGIDDPVQFDLDSDGEPEELSWTDRADPFLVLDRNGNGKVDHGGELFGNFTQLASGLRAANGYEALKELDGFWQGGNGNREIDPGDSVFSSLRLWTDTNHNGVSEPEELESLQDAFVSRISLRYLRSGRRDEHGNEWRFFSWAWVARPGRAEILRATWDVFFVVRH